MKSRATAVIDIGKSKVRLSAVDDRGLTLATLQRGNSVVAKPPYPHFDSDDLFAWLLDGLKTFARQFEIHWIVPVAHGAAAALLEGQRLALPIMDYEFEGPGEFDSEYDALARDFASTASPKLPAGLNLGRQLFWQQRHFPGEFERATILPYPQYWAWRLSEVASWEPTSLGCHTDLWEPGANQFSKFAKSMKWDARFARRASASTTLGTVAPAVREVVGLPETCRVLAGIHDSNAAFFAHRATRDQPFCIVSTGTWIIAMAHGSPLGRLRENLDMLANVDALERPVPTARFMGGREYAAICGENALSDSPTVEDLRKVMSLGALAVPTFSGQGGPFPGLAGRIVGDRPQAPRHRAALAALYCALVTDYCLDLLDARGDVIVEGRFAANHAFTTALAALRSPNCVLSSADESGTVRGAAALVRVARNEPPCSIELSVCAPALVEQVVDARARWRSLLPAFPGAAGSQ